MLSSAPGRRLSAAFLFLVLMAGCDAPTPQSLVAAGRELESKRDFPGAIIQYKAALQADRTATEARVLLGRALLLSGDANAAAVELTKALEEGAKADEVVPLLARALVAGGSFRKLVSEHGSVKLADPKARAEYQSQLAAAWGLIGNRSKTNDAIAAALEAVPGHPEALLLMARVRAGEGKFQEAYDLAEQVLAKDSSNADAWLLKGELLFSWRRDRAASEKALLKAIAAKPDLALAHVSVVSLRLRNGDIPGAKAQVAAFRAAVPGHHHLQFVDAQLAYAEGRFVEARESIQALLRNFPDHEEALALSGGIEARLGALVQASAQLGKALSLQPSHQAARLTLAEVELRLGQHTKALATLKSLLEAKEPSATALAIAGNAELRLGRPAAAQRYFQRAAASEPGNIRHKTAAMMASVAMGDALQALNELENLAKNSDSTHADEALFAARLGRGELDAALATLDSIAKKRPESAEPYEMRGRVLLMRRDLAGARAAFEQALKIDPAFYVATSNLALIDMIEAQPDAAIKRLRGAIERDPKNSQAMVTLAEVLVRQGAQVNEVKALFTEAVAATPLEAEPRLKLIEYTLRRRQLKDALAAAQDAVAALPGDVRILEAVGNAQVQAGDVEQGINTFRRLATSLPTSPMPYMKLADAYQLSNAREQMVAAAKKAVDIAPESSEAQAKLVDVLMRSGQPKVALEHARRMRAVKPQSPTGYLLEAIYESRSGNDAGAIAALREGVERTKSADIAGKLYSLLLKTERTSEAEKFGSAWLRSHPRDAAFEYLVSVADISRGDLSSAEARLRRVVNVYRDNVVALNNLAWVLAKTGKPGGIEFAQRAVNLSPDVPELLDTLAMTLAADRQWGAAIKTQKRALELAPDNAGLRLGLARIALDSGDKVTAGTELQRLEKLGAAFPGQGEVRELRSRL